MKQLILTLCVLCSLPTGLLDIARSHLGTPYVGGVLEGNADERLVIDEGRLDCTTFVELTVAQWLSEQDNEHSFEQQVQAMRYRKGEINGYLSRLHYFTDWVVENTRRGIWYEVVPEEEDNTIWRHDTLSLSFMSQHPQSYPFLKAHAWAVDSMRAIEQRYDNYRYNYIDKQFLNLPPSSLPIKDGDIIALVTTIEGLDVTHLGFAVWKNDKLHLMHASMTHGKVVIDERTLYDYLKGRKNCPGVRVVRLKMKDER